MYFFEWMFQSMRHLKFQCFLDSIVSSLDVSSLEKEAPFAAQTVISYVQNANEWQKNTALCIPSPRTANEVGGIIDCNFKNDSEEKM
mmetsp:Transcript_6035/g.9287  ORF Transcript_6035/g.9287 Transcript_6035/m.9287 type:complete len:87 (+) Transcript_6035:38-298(+)